MPALPPSSNFTDSSVTEGLFKTAITNQREFLADLLGTNGTKATALATLGSMFGSLTARSTNYTVVAGDRGKIIQCTATLELALTAAATLGSSFSFVVNNTGSGTVTINPSGSELIDGQLTKALSQNKSALVYCDGSSFYTVGLVEGGVTSLNGQTGAITNTDYGAIGSYVIAAENTFSANALRLQNVTVAGSSLIRSDSTSATGVQPFNSLQGTSVNSGTAISLSLSGTWRRMTRSRNGTSADLSAINLYVRIS